MTVRPIEPTNSPSDRVIWIPIEGLFRMEGHLLRGTGEEFVPRDGEPIPAEHKEVSAVMLTLRDSRSGFALDGEINKLGKEATLAWPIADSLASRTPLLSSSGETPTPATPEPPPAVSSSAQL